jgi:hypothetical protein
MRANLLSLALPALLLGLLPACGNKREAEALLVQIQDEDYRSTYARAPGWMEPLLPAQGGPHGDFIDLYINDVMVEAIESGETLTEWPDGSIIVKDAWRDAEGTSLRFIALMEKRGSDSWFWAEYDDSDKVEIAGCDKKVCVDCHESGDDQVRAFGFP